MAARYRYRYLRIREQATRAHAALRPTVRVKVPHAALLASAMTTIAGFGVALLAMAVVHRAPLAAVLGGCLLHVFSQQLRQLIGWWRHDDHAQVPIPICWEMQLLSVVAAGLLWAWIRVLLSAWLTT